MEQLFDLYKSTLASNYTPGSGTLLVNSATGLPSTGSFTLTVLNASTLVVEVVLHVTAISGTTLTVVAEGSDNAASANDIVVGYMDTTRSKVAQMQDWLGYGSFANLPATTGRKTGQRYKTNDAPYELILDDGTEYSPPLSAAWVPFLAGFKCVLPVAGNFSNFNNAGTGITFVRDDTHGYLTIKSTGSSTTGQICGATKASLAATYTATFMLSAAGGDLSVDNQCGICVTDGTKFIAMAVQWFPGSSAQVFFNISKYTNATTFSLDYFATQSPLLYTGFLFFRIVEDATHRTYYVSTDGVNFLQALQTAVGDFLTTTRYGVFVRGDAAAATQAVTLWSITESNP